MLITIHLLLEDFGMSRVISQTSPSATTRSETGPLKWVRTLMLLFTANTLKMAPESLSKYEYSTKTDVWSFGKILIHIYTPIAYFSIGIVMIEILTRDEP